MKKLSLDKEELFEKAPIPKAVATLVIPFLSFDFMAVAIFQACWKGKISLLFAIARKILLEIPAMIILEKIFEMYSMAYGQLVAEFTLTIFSIFVLRKIIREVPDYTQI